MEETQTPQPKKTRSRLTQERKDLILSLKRSGKTHNYIREHTGHSLGTIVKVLKDAKIKSKKAPKKEKPIVKPETPLEQATPVKTNFLQRIAISLCRSLGVTGRMYGNN